ncbi:MAG: hypothetical protein ABIR37_02215 [Candidatus Saccharimonadales bacterium]
MSESLPEKKTKKWTIEAAVRLGWFVREHVSFMPGQDVGRYERHNIELKQRLRTVHPHAIKHHKLHNFIAGIPDKFPEQHIEDDRVRLIKALRLEPGRNWESLKLITSALCNDRHKAKTAKDIERAAYAGSRSSAPLEMVYREVAADQKACAWVLNLNAEATAGITEYIVPTEIQGIVIGFSGLGISHMSQINDSALTVRFYSVPEEQ